MSRAQLLQAQYPAARVVTVSFGAGPRMTMAEQVGSDGAWVALCAGQVHQAASVRVGGDVSGRGGRVSDTANTQSRGMMRQPGPLVATRLTPAAGCHSTRCA